MDIGGKASDLVTAQQLINRSTAILLDFDGPVCSVFAGLPASAVADELREMLNNAQPSARLLRTTDDPLGLLLQASNVSAAAEAAAERLLAAAELEAVTSAEPTPGALQFLEAMRHDKRPVAIVSNNGEAAIRSYLELHGLTRLVTIVSGRDPSDARFMKPHPKSLLVAMARLGCKPDDSVMVGDSVSDVAAAHAAGVRVIALANKQHKRAVLESEGPDATVANMHALVSQTADPGRLSTRRQPG